MSTFISHFLEHTHEYESPGSFWKWAAYATIAGALRDQCYRRRGDSYLYTNVYILFYASSGQRKGAPVELSESLLTSINHTKVISGRASVQAILDELSKTETNSKTGKVIKGGSAIFYAPELAAGIVDDPAAVKILTDIYDFKINAYRSYLRTGPRFGIEKMVFSILAATNEEIGQEFLTTVAVRGGLLARSFVVFPNEYRKANSLMEYTDTTKSFDCLSNKLKAISELHGEFIFTPDAMTEYTTWYVPYHDSLKGKADRTGILGRMQTSIVKLAMLLAANDLSLEVRREHVEQAIMEGLGLLPNYNRFVISSGTGSIKEAGAVFLQELLKSPNHTRTQKELLQIHWNTFDSELLQKLVTTLELGGLIITTLQGSVISYTLTAKCLEVMKSA